MYTLIQRRSASVLALSLFFTATSSQAIVTKKEIDFSSDLDLPFTASGSITRWYFNEFTSEQMVLSESIQTSTSGIVAKQPTAPGFPWLPGYSMNPWCDFTLTFSPNVIGFSLKLFSTVSGPPALYGMNTHAGGSWAFDEVNPLLGGGSLPFTYFASEGNYIESVLWSGANAGFIVSGIDLYFAADVAAADDTSSAVPEGGSPLASWAVALVALGAIHRAFERRAKMS